MWKPESEWLKAGNDSLGALSNQRDLPSSEARLERIEAALTMALEAGAQPPIEYIGEGMTAVVFCDEAAAYKVAKSERATHNLADEAEWLEAANQLEAVRPHVPELYRWDELHGVLVRECVQGRPGGWSAGARTRALYDSLQPHMLSVGWTMPEYKEDSFVFGEDDDRPVLVDVGFALRVGNRLLFYVRDVLAGVRQRDPGDDDSTLAFYVRREIGEGPLDEDLAQELLAELYARGARE